MAGSSRLSDAPRRTQGENNAYFRRSTLLATANRSIIQKAHSTRAFVKSKLIRLSGQKSKASKSCESKAPALSRSQLADERTPKTSSSSTWTTAPKWFASSRKAKFADGCARPTSPASRRTFARTLCPGIRQSTQSRNYPDMNTVRTQPKGRRYDIMVCGEGMLGIVSEGTMFVCVDVHTEYRGVSRVSPADIRVWRSGKWKACLQDTVAIYDNQPIQRI